MLMVISGIVVTPFLLLRRFLGLFRGFPQPSFRDAPLGADPESIFPMVVMDSGSLVSLAPRNDNAWKSTSPQFKLRL
jgi:hypothetical protein